MIYKNPYPVFAELAGRPLKFEDFEKQNLKQWEVLEKSSSTPVGLWILWIPQAEAFLGLPKSPTFWGLTALAAGIFFGAKAVAKSMNKSADKVTNSVNLASAQMSTSVNNMNATVEKASQRLEGASVNVRYASQNIKEASDNMKNANVNANVKIEDASKIAETVRQEMSQIDLRQIDMSKFLISNRWRNNPNQPEPLSNSKGTK